jgi:hypothetical protein
MATTNKTAKSAKSTTVKKPAAKKPAAKAVPAKKPAAKPVVKKPAAKAVPAKKPAVKPGAKKPAAKAAPAKKPAAKPGVKKPVAKAAPAKKPAAKPAAVKKAVAVKAASAKKPALKPAAEKPAAAFRLMDLFDAYAQDKLPRDHGFVVSSFFSENSAYSIYEVVSYSGVKEIQLTGTGLIFVTGGKKLYILVEPGSYPQKYMEPVSRKEGEQIPKRFSELEIITARNQTKIMVAKETNETYGSFTVLKPTGDNFARVLYNLPDVLQTLEELFEKSFNKEAGIPLADARAAGTLVAQMVDKTMSFKGEFA